MAYEGCKRGETMINVKQSEELRAAIRAEYGYVSDSVDTAIRQITSTAKRSKWCDACKTSHVITDFPYDIGAADRRGDVCKRAMRRYNTRLNKTRGVLTMADRLEILRRMAGVDPVADIAKACRIAPATIYEMAHKNGISLSRIYHKWDADDYELIAALRDEGLTWQQIGNKYEVSKEKAAAWWHSKKRELTRKDLKANI